MTPLPLLAALAATFQVLPPLSFMGLRAGMPIEEATQVIESGRGMLRCRASTDVRIRECTGSLPHDGVDRPLDVLISSIRDSAAVIVLSGLPPAEMARDWIEDLALDFGRPIHRTEHGIQDSWQWIRRSRMLRVVVRTPGEQLQTSVTLTDGPLLDGLGPATKKPD